MDSPFVNNAMQSKLAAPLHRGHGPCSSSVLHTHTNDTTYRVRFSDMVDPKVVKQLSLDERRPDAVPGDAVLVRAQKQAAPPRDKFVCIKCAPRGAGWVSFATFHYGNKKAMTAAEFSSGFIKNKKPTSFIGESGCD